MKLLERVMAAIVLPIGLFAIWAGEFTLAHPDYGGAPWIPLLFGCLLLAVGTSLTWQCAACLLGALKRRGREVER